MKRAIMFDIDGVLADFITGFSHLASGLFGAKPFGTNDMKAWDDFPGLTRDEVDSTWDVIRKSDTFWAGLPALASWETMVYGIDKIQKHLDVYFVTQRSAGVRVIGQTKFWLGHHGISSPNVIISGNKGYMAHALGVTHCIDDKAGNAVFTGYEAEGVTSYIIDRPYNRFDPKVIGSKVKRVTSVDEFIENVREAYQI